MKILENMESCYGCGACYNACPTSAICMKETAEGFLAPVIDEKSCVSCGKCRTVCPAIKQSYPNNVEPDMYAFAAEERVLHDSSSGGIFTFLAEHVLKAGGYVVGAAYDSNFLVNHVIISDKKDLDKIRRSKYLQSSTGDTFKKVKELLEKGEAVLYSGCPCQIAGLLVFLGKDYDKLYTVDVLCHGVPSPGLFREHLRNSFGGVENIEDVEFRSREGWSVLFHVKLKNGNNKVYSDYKNAYTQSFLQDINLRASCFQCQYSRLPRQGDVTIGDLWSAWNMGLPFDYGKGVSIVLLNNQKGEELFQKALAESEYKYYVHKLYGAGVEKPCDLKALNGNIFASTVNAGGTARRQKFFEDCSHMEFEKAVHASLHQYDVGLMLYMSNNYGSIATNYALYQVIANMGKRVAVLDNLFFIVGHEPVAFARKYMQVCSSFMEKNDSQAANQCFETFVVGSDMAWNWEFLPFEILLSYTMLGFADGEKRLLSYASSFGARKGLNLNERTICSYYLKRFDAVSVREDYGVDMCRDLFDIEAKQVLDPVLLTGKSIWDKLSDNSQLTFTEGYLYAYILDPTPSKRSVIIETAKRLNKKLIVVSDLAYNIETNKRVLNLDENLVRPGFIDWLAYIRHADCIITDSFHGACFSIIYGKKFVAIKNRSKERFDSLARLAGCPEVFFEDGAWHPGEGEPFPNVDYVSLSQRMESKRKESLEWLRTALDMEIKPKGDNGSVQLVLKLFESLQQKTNDIERMKNAYSYVEERKAAINEQLKAGKTWLEVISSENEIVLEDFKLRDIENVKEYFSALREFFHYVIIFSCADEGSIHWKRLLEATGFPLRADLGWRESYVAVVEEGAVKIDKKSWGELCEEYEFTIGHPKYDVEYVDGQLKVGCKPLERCRIKVKSKGFSGTRGAWKSEIMVDNTDYSINKTGINIVVINKETGRVVDSFNVNTYADPGLSIRRA